MNAASRPSRSPELLSREDSALLVIDVQSSMLGAIPQAPQLLWNLQRLITAANTFQVPLFATEQNPDKLGRTVSELAGLLPAAYPKLAFSAARCEELLPALRDRSIYKVLLAGIETHVCVLQTAFDLIAEGFRVFVAADACGSRHTLDEQLAWRRLEASGASVLTTEMAIFEWCDAAGTAEFRQLSTLIKQQAP